MENRERIRLMLSCLNRPSRVPAEPIAMPGPFVLDWGSTPPGALYPNLYVVEPGRDDDFGRRFMTVEGLYDQCEDPLGRDANRFGLRAYDYAVYDYIHPSDRRWELDFLRAAELLYLHAASKGSAEGWLFLGRIYFRDLCEGDYWDGPWPDGGEPPTTTDERAYLCLRSALRTQPGLSLKDGGEACRLLGELLCDGRGCERDAGAAWRCFDTAWRAIEEEEASRESWDKPWPSDFCEEALVAVDMGEVLELGEGCTRNLRAALGCYERALEAFAKAGLTGDGCMATDVPSYDIQRWYVNEPVRARRGLRRVGQELGGEGRDGITE